MRKAMSYGVLAATAMTITGASLAQASTLLYGFESGDSPDAVDGFAKNGGPATFTVTPSNIGVTQGSNSALFTVTPAGFAGAITSSLPPALSDPTTNAISLDLTVPSDFTYSGGYALIGVTIFIYNPTTADAEQFQVAGSDEQAIPFSTPGVTTPLNIPLTGADPLTGATVPYAAILAEGYVPTGFEFFFDKNAAITVAIDNVQAVGVPEPASLGLAALGAGSLLTRRRRQA